MLEVVLDRQAERDLESAFNDYEYFRPGWGFKLLSSFERALDAIRPFPKIGTPYEDGMYSYPLKKFPFRSCIK